MKTRFLCPKTWDELTEVSSLLRYCGACDRLIPDLTQAGKDEVERWLQLQGGRACGRFLMGEGGRPHFLERPAVAASTLLLTAALNAALAYNAVPEPPPPMLEGAPPEPGQLTAAEREALSAMGYIDLSD